MPHLLVFACPKGAVPSALSTAHFGAITRRLALISTSMASGRPFQKSRRMRQGSICETSGRAQLSSVFTQDTAVGQKRQQIKHVDQLSSGLAQGNIAVRIRIIAFLSASQFPLMGFRNERVRHN